ncbi:hypothetical protein [Acidicapsa ligni]|uniref:hypothetical protein n=1 Tax=Acidicapsa ligni TaxID=542300 RepID=UPI0021E0C038|nr:hypothetical protein [Acidicapsa ligni]
MEKFSTFLERYKASQALIAELMFLKGRTHIVWVHGVSYFGGLLFLGMTVMDIDRHRHQYTGWREIAWLLGSLAVYCGIGYLYGIWRWRQLKRQVGER